MKNREIYDLMGKMVVVNKILEREANQDFRRWREIKSIQNRTGWVTGVRWLQIGIKVAGSHYGTYGEEGYEPPYFEQTGKPKKCLTVVFWPTEKPVYVPMDGYQRTPENHIDCLIANLPKPHRTTWRDKITDPDAIIAREKLEENEREQMRDEAKTYPRDKKGRWSKNAK